MVSVIGLVYAAWHIAQCLLTYEVVAVTSFFLAPLLQFVVWFYIFKIAERYIVKKLFDENHLLGMDAVWLPYRHNPLVVNFLLCFESEGSVDERIDHFRRAILERMVNARKANGKWLYPRVRCYIRSGLFQTFFSEDRDFKIANHVWKWEGDVPRSEAELAAVISKLNTESLPEGRSPWCFVCIPTNYGDNDMFVLYRIAHTVADGIAITKFLTHQLPDKVIPQRETQNFSSTGRPLLMAKALLMAPLFTIRRFLSPADESLLHGPKLNGVKAFAWSEPFELKLIKEIKAAAGTTVNDVVMSCFSVALRKYLQRKGVENPTDLTVSVAVDVRSPASSKVISYENQFAFIFPQMAVATGGTRENLYEMQARMNEVKVSGASLLMGATISLAHELFPQFWTKMQSIYLTKKGTCIYSNVSGPQHEFTVRGSRLKYATFFPPHKDNMGVGLSVFTYAGQVVIGVQGDLAVLPDPGIVVEEFGNAVNELAKSVLRNNNPST